MKADMSASSQRFLKGIKWLEDELKFDGAALKTRIKEIEPEAKERKKKGNFILQQELDELNMKVKLRCEWHDNPEAAFILKKSGSDLVEEFMAAAENDAFWHEEKVDYWTEQDAHKFWFLRKLGLGDNPHFADAIEYLIKYQSVEGYVTQNMSSHIGFVRVLVEAGMESKTLSNAIDYWLSTWKSYHLDPRDIAIGVLALTELDYQRYSDAIREESDFLREIQNNDGSWGKESIAETAYSLWALSRTSGIEDSSALKGLEFLSKNQRENGSWMGDPWATTYGLLGLLMMGEGPKVSMELVDYESMRCRQNLRRAKPIFLHTSPLYKNSLSIKDIHDKVREMIHGAEREIRITSPFIDMLYEEIIDIKREKPNVIFKIITRPKKEAEGIRDRIARNVVDLLNIAAKGNVVESPLVHSRMIIVDDSEVLVSSSDLTRDQLFDEFNAGIWTSDGETVVKAIEFFDNFFALENKKEAGSKS